MNKLQKSCIALLLSAAVPQYGYAAQELTPEKADSLHPFKEISIRGQYYSGPDSVRAMSKAADREGAAYFYITSENPYPGNDSLRVVYAKLYKSDAQEVKTEENYRQFMGVYEYPKTKAIRFEPYDLLKIRGYFPTPVQLNNAIAKAAAEKGAYAFFIDRQVQTNGNNTQVTAYLFKKDAAERHLQPENAIPYDSEAGQAALAQGGEAAMQVERPGFYSPSAFNQQFYENKFNTKESEVVVDTNAENAITDSSSDVKKLDTKNQVNQQNTAQSAVIENTSKTEPAKQSILPKTPSTRYGVTLSDGTRIEELNDATALKMVPFDTIKFRGYFVSSNEISYQAAKKAAENGAKYYHISRVAQERGSNVTVYVELYR